MQSLRCTAKASQTNADDRQRDGAEAEEEYRLKCVYPCGAAHTAKEHIAHHYEGNDCAAKPERHEATADRGERCAAAHDSDDDVRHEQDGLHHEDHCSDVTTFPTIPEHLHRRHETVFLAQGPDACADQKN